MKVRFVAREFRWKELRAVLFYPGASFSTGRLVDAIAQRSGWDTFLLDDINAFLHCPEDEAVRVDPQRLWLEAEIASGRPTDTSWQLLKTIYGRRVGPQRWARWCADVLVF